MREAWLLAGERMPVAGPAAPQLRFARIERWLGELGYETTVVFGGRLEPRSGRRRGTLRALLDALTSPVAAPRISFRALRRRPALLLCSGAVNAHAAALVKRLLGERVIVIVDALGLRSLETEQTTRLSPLRGPYRFLWRRLERSSFRAADLVLAINDRGAELVAQVCPEARIATLRDAAEEEVAEIAPASRERYGIPGQAVAVGFLGSIVCSRLDPLLAAWETVQRGAGDESPELHLVVIGSGPDLARYRDRAARGGIPGVSFLGALPRDEALSVLRSCDIAYTGSWSRAGFSFKLFEYLALGMPILVERKPQMEEVLRDGRDAVFYEGERELAAELERLGGDAELRESLGAAARRTFLDSHTLERRQREFAELLRGLRSRRAHPLHLLELGLAWPPETFVGWRMRGLAQRGFRITAAAARRPGRDGRERGPDGIEVIPLTEWDASRAIKLAELIRFGIPLALRRPSRLRALIRAARASAARSGGGWSAVAGILHLCIPLARLDPDLVHIDWETAAITYGPLLEAWDRPVVMSCHGGGISHYPHGTRGPMFRRELPQAFERASAIHCVAQAVARKAIGLGAPSERIRVIRSAVDPSFFSPNSRRQAVGHGNAREDPEADGHFRLVTVADLKPTKGHEYGLLAVAALLAAGVPVRHEIVGRVPNSSMSLPSDLPRLRHAIDDLRLNDHVLIRGGLPSAGVRDAFRRADAVLHPSVHEGLPTVVVEAMSCGLPVVVTDIGGTRELIEDGVEGFLVKPRDPRGLAAAASRLWEDPELRRRMGEAARRRVLHEFDLEGRLDEFAELFTEVAART